MDLGNFQLRQRMPINDQKKYALILSEAPENELSKYGLIYRNTFSTFTWSSKASGSLRVEFSRSINLTALLKTPLLKTVP